MSKHDTNNIEAMSLIIRYSTTDHHGNYAKDIRVLLKDQPYDKICNLVIFGSFSDSEYHNVLKEIKSGVRSILERDIPVTLIPQRVLPLGHMAAEIYITDTCKSICYCKMNGICYGIVTGNDYSLLFTEGGASSDFSSDVKTQSNEVFENIEKILSLHGFQVNDIVRQWNYIGNITCHREGRQNYQEFNDSRSAYYLTGEWRNGYPAATGISTASDGIIVSCIAYKASEGIYPINNPLQTAAHVYSKDVLIDEKPGALKTTPKFERAKVIEVGDSTYCFVSGTAAIRGEESMQADSARLQTLQTIENIRHLVSEENLARHGCHAQNLKYTHLRIYIKHESDFNDIKDVVEMAYPGIPAIYTVADVCRSELLVEIEGILIS